ncbi:MAG: hypothetical protein GC154_00165 [bacterium]|nr:hypothetical protein [bacterium]
MTQDGVNALQGVSGLVFSVGPRRESSSVTESAVQPPVKVESDSTRQQDANPPATPSNGAAKIDLTA